MNKNILKNLYIKAHKSVPEIAKDIKCSEHKVNYWLSKYKIPKRTISEAIYIKYNPKGDPFKFNVPKTVNDAKLFGLGLGIYWGEGNRMNKNSVKLGNSDPSLLRTFIKFLTRLFSVKKNKLKFQLHIFTDIDIKEAERYWMREIKLDKNQFYKPVIIKSGSLGTYRRKSRYGVLTIYFNNTKLKKILDNELPG
jgi:hypothetical protein